MRSPLGTDMKLIVQSEDWMDYTQIKGHRQEEEDKASAGVSDL